nr:MAG TPA: hypothetical protein [Caudoviricetes sp.]
MHIYIIKTLTSPHFKCAISVFAIISIIIMTRFNYAIAI